MTRGFEELYLSTSRQMLIWNIAILIIVLGVQFSKQWHMVFSVSANVLGIPIILQYLERRLAQYILEENFCVPFIKPLRAGFNDVAVYAVASQNFPALFLLLIIILVLSLYACSKYCCFVGSVFPYIVWKFSSRRFSGVMIVLLIIVNVGLVPAYIYNYIFKIGFSGTAIELGVIVGSIYAMKRVLLRMKKGGEENSNRRILIFRSFHNIVTDRHLSSILGECASASHIATTLISPIGRNYRHYSSWFLRTDIYRPFRFQYEFLAPPENLWKPVVKDQLDIASAATIDLTMQTESLIWESNEVLKRAANMECVVLLCHNDQKDAPRIRAWVEKFERETDTYFFIYGNLKKRHERKTLASKLLEQVGPFHLRKSKPRDRKGLVAISCAVVGLFFYQLCIGAPIWEEKDLNDWLKHYSWAVPPSTICKQERILFSSRSSMYCFDQLRKREYLVTEITEDNCPYCSKDGPAGAITIQPEWNMRCKSGDYRVFDDSCNGLIKGTTIFCKKMRPYGAHSDPTMEKKVCSFLGGLAAQ